MSRFFINRHAFVLMAAILMTFAVGCGGGGGGGGVVSPTVEGTYVEAPGTVSTLAQSQAPYNYSNSAANISMALPVQSGAAVSYLLSVTNNSTTSSQNVALFPETSFAASVKPEQAEGVMASLISADDHELLTMAAIKGQLQEKLRQNTLNAMRQTGGNLRASMRASDNRGEVPGQNYPISLVSDSMGFSYITRSCKLERKTAHCKIFVDQEDFQGLSAITGSYAVSSADLDHFASEFESYIYPLMNQNYGYIYGSDYASVYDIDNDKCLSILISPVYAKIGFAGLFNSIDMTPGATTNSNQRDLIGIWSPSSSKWSGEYWRAATRETIAHEMQHAINYSAKVYPGGVARTGISNYDSLLEEMWLDESLSVCAEARYRTIRGENGRTTFYNNQTMVDSVGNDSRFNYWARNPYSVRVDIFSYTANAFEHYGQKGLFNFYLYEQYGSDKIRQLCQSATTGMTNFNNVFGAGSFATIVKQWQFAATNEGLRTSGLININNVNSKYRYQAALGLTTVHQAVQFDASFPAAVNVAAGATAYYVVKQPQGTSGSEFKFRIQSNEGQAVEINMMRLP